MPLRLLANRSRSGAYLIMLFLATAMFGIFFFLTIFVQEVLGYSALRSGLAFLPFAAMIVVMSGIVSQLIPRLGARPLMLAGTVVATGGMFWFSQLTEHSSYAGGLLGPMLVTSAGFGMLFVPLSLVALNRVRGEDSGVASSLLNTGQQLGGAIGLAALGTVTWSAVANSIKHQAAAAAAAAAHAGHPLPAARAGGQVPTAMLQQALATGISRGFLVATGIAVLALVTVLLAIRVRRSDLTGATSPPVASPAPAVTRSSGPEALPEAAATS
jgi:MFS family permease